MSAGGIGRNPTGGTVKLTTDRGGMGRAGLLPGAVSECNHVDSRLHQSLQVLLRALSVGSSGDSRGARRGLTTGWLVSPEET